MKKYILVFLLVMTFITQSCADVEKITNYTIIVDLDKNPSHIKDIITIKNLVDYPLVPGIGELRLQRQGARKLGIIPIPFTKEVEPVKIRNLKGYYSLGNGKLTPMKTYVKYNNNYSTIYYEVWDPIKKRGNITLIIEYDANIVDNGILFKTVSIPVGCDMDIDHLHVKFNTTYSETYQNPSGNDFEVPKNTLFILNAEFSILPLPKLPTYGYILLWLTIFIILVVILIYTEIKRTGKKKEEKKEEAKTNTTNTTSSIKK